MYYGKTHNGNQVSLETHCTIVRIPDSPDNVYFGHVTLEIIYNDSNGTEQKPKWHFGAKVINDFPQNLTHTFWKHSQQDVSFKHHDFVGKYGTFTHLRNNVQLSTIMRAHFTKCYEFFTTKKQWKQVWRDTDVIEGENADVLLDRLKQEKQARETFNFNFQLYEQQLEQFKEREHSRKLQELAQARAQEQRELQEKAGLVAAVQLQEQFYREEHERQQLPQQQEQEPGALFKEWMEQSNSANSSVLQKNKIEEQATADRLFYLQEQTRIEEEARKAKEETRKEEEEKRQARLLSIRQHNLLTKQQQEKLEQEQKDRHKEEESAYLEKQFERSKVERYLQSIEQKETIISKMEKSLKSLNLMSEYDYNLTQKLSEIYNSHIIELSSRIEGIRSNESLNITDKQEFLDILEKKREYTLYLLHVVSSKGRAYKLYLKIQEIEDFYTRNIVFTEKDLKTLRYKDEDKGKLQLTRRFLIKYYQQYEDLDSDSQSLRDEEHQHIRDQLEELSTNLVNHRKRLTELCTEEAPFIIEYYRINYNIFDEDDEFIISQIRILIPFLDKEMANDIVKRARQTNGGRLTTKYIIENKFPEGFYILDSINNERLLDLFPARRIMVNEYKRQLRMLKLFDHGSFS